MNEAKIREEFYSAQESLSYMDYGCDGADECCGCCAGLRLREEKVLDWFLAKRKEEVEEIIAKIKPMRCTCGGDTGGCLDINDIINLLKAYE